MGRGRRFMLYSLFKRQEPRTQSYSCNTLIIIPLFPFYKRIIKRLISEPGDGRKYRHIGTLVLRIGESPGSGRRVMGLHCKQYTRDQSYKATNQWRPESLRRSVNGHGHGHQGSVHAPRGNGKAHRDSDRQTLLLQSTMTSILDGKVERWKIGKTRTSRSIYPEHSLHLYSAAKAPTLSFQTPFRLSLVSCAIFLSFFLISSPSGPRINLNARTNSFVIASEVASHVSLGRCMIGLPTTKPERC